MTVRSEPWWLDVRAAATELTTMLAAEVALAEQQGTRQPPDKPSLVGSIVGSGRRRRARHPGSLRDISAVIKSHKWYTGGGRGKDVVGRTLNGELRLLSNHLLVTAIVRACRTIRGTQLADTESEALAAASSRVRDLIAQAEAHDDRQRLLPVLRSPMTVVPAPNRPENEQRTDPNPPHTVITGVVVPTAAALAEPDRPQEPVGLDRPPRRRLAVPLVVAVFLAGVGAGVTGTLGWAHRVRQTAVAPEAPPEAADVCAPPEAADPAGEDVLRLPPVGQMAGSWWVNDTKAADLRSDGHRIEADVAKGTTRPGDVVIVKGDVDLVRGRQYALAFTALADRVTTIRVRVQDSPPTYQESYTQDLQVSPSACRHVYRFVAASTSAHSELTYQVGGHAEDFHLTIAEILLVAEPT